MDGCKERKNKGKNGRNRKRDARTSCIDENIKIRGAGKVSKAKSGRGEIKVIQKKNCKSAQGRERHGGHGSYGALQSRSYAQICGKWQR